MNRLDPVTFRKRVAEFEAAVHACPEIAAFCSGPDWQWAAHQSLLSRNTTGNFLIAEEDGTWLLFQENSPSAFFPLESAWCFGCPVIGEPEAGISLLRKVTREWYPEGAGYLITGVRHNGDLHNALQELESEASRYSEFPTTDCMAIDLSQGVEPWLQRRSRKFRRTIRNLAVPEDISIEAAHGVNPDELFERMLAVQKRTYKWMDGTDILLGETYCAFYRDLLERLSKKGAVRVHFARRGGEDIAYLFGGVSGKTFRGFQMSYIEEVKSLGIGNSLQLENMRSVHAEGITHYDLGMHSDYKERWADVQEKYIGIFLVIH